LVERLVHKEKGSFLLSLIW
jgi:hypothetical protein